MNKKEQQSLSLNVLSQPLKICGLDPLTGFTRSGFCETSPTDFGKHTVCAVVTKEFLAYTKEQGNDLSSPNPQFGFPGLQKGDRWCLCASRWLQAEQAGVAPLVDLDSTEISTLDVIPLEILKKYSYM